MPIEKSQAELEREKIVVTNNGNEDEVVEGRDEVIEGDKEEDKEEAEEVEEKEVELTEEQIAAKEVEEKEAKRQAKIDKRIAKEVGARKALETELAQAKAKLEELFKEKGEVFTKEDINIEAKKIAAQEIANDAFEKAAHSIFEASLKVDKNFKKKVDAMAEEIGLIPGNMVMILDDIDNKGVVLNYLTDNTDEAEEIYSMSPAKMALQLAKLSTKLEKKVAKPISRVPPPNDLIGGNTKSPSVLTGKESMADFVRIRAEQVEARRKAKMGSR